MTEYDRTKVLTVSSVRSFYQCRRRFKLEYIDDVQPRRENAEARRGTAIHEALADRAFDVPWDDSKAKLLRNFPDDASELNGLFSYCEEMYGNPPIVIPPESEINVLHEEAGFLLDSRGKFPERTDDEAVFAGRIDLVFDTIGSNAVTVRDYKTGRTIEPPWDQPIERDMQLRVYAYAACQMFPDAQTVVLQLDHIRHRRREVEVPREEFDGVWNEIVTWTKPVYDAIDAGEFPAKPGDLCGWCSARDHCDVWTNALVLAESELPAESSGYAIQNAQDALRLASIVRVVKQRVKRADEALRAYVEREGAIRGDGESLDVWPATKPRVNVPGVVSALRDGGISNEQILGAMTLTKTAAMDLIKGRSKEASALRKGVLALIEDEPTTRFEWRKDG